MVGSGLNLLLGLSTNNECWLIRRAKTVNTDHSESKSHALTLTLRQKLCYLLVFIHLVKFLLQESVE